MRRAGSAAPASNGHGSAALAIAVLVVVAACAPDDGEREQRARPQTGGGVLVHLYFPGPDDRLHAEARRLARGLETPGERLRALAQLWLEGPESDRLTRPLPQVELLHVDLGTGGRLYADLVPREGGERPRLGSTEEAGALYSLVNTLALNVPEVREVVVLWNGVQPATLGGHLDTGVPLRPRIDLIASGGE